VVAALIGWGLALLLTTPTILGRVVIPVNVARLLENGLPPYLALIIIVALTTVTRLQMQRTTFHVAVAFLLLSLLPVGMTFIITGSSDNKVLARLFSPSSGSTVAIPLPEEPIIDPNRPDMVFVPAGPFIRGSLSPLQFQAIVGNKEGDEQPVQSIYLDAFYIDITEVINMDFARFVEATGYVTEAEQTGESLIWNEAGWQMQPGAQWRHPAGLQDSIEGKNNHPVVQVTWNDAKAYCEWRGKRLLTEAEWEKAARGTDGRNFPWGNDFDPARVNYCDRDCEDLPQHKDDTGADGFRRTAPVGSFPDGVSPYGALDMAGNVWEWVEDWYDPYYYEYSPATNPHGPIQLQSYKQSKVVRGGSWTSESGYVRTTGRSYDPPDWRAYGVGIRCAQDS
jgi:formylglycine-generating enzyme required for sulfatase activity